MVHSLLSDQLIPRAEMGVYPSLVQKDTFAADYDHVHIVSAPGFNYWVFERDAP